MVARRGHSLRHVAAVVFFLFIFYHIVPSGSEHRPLLTAIKSRFDWASVQPFHPPVSITSLPPGRPRELRRIQHRFGRQSRFWSSGCAGRRRAVQKAFRKCWENYKQHAWLKDELEPLSGSGKNTFGGWAATLVDSLDTLWIMGLKHEFKEAVEAVASFDWANTPESSVNMFETTIRHLGGLLSAYDLSKEPVLLHKATELGDMLYVGFDTPNRMPSFWLDFEKARTGNLVADDHQPSASVASLSMEFTRLSQLTGDQKYYDAVSRVTELLYRSQNATRLPGMFPTFFNMEEAIVTADTSFTLGALSDSLYEYLPKMYALLGGLEPVYEKLYRASAEAITNHLLFRPMTPDNADILFSGTVNVDRDIRLDAEGQHLSCFVGGMFALGGRLFAFPEHVEIGSRLARGCVGAYDAFPTGIMPEIFGLVPCASSGDCDWNDGRWKREVVADEHGHSNLPKGFRNARDPKYILRPEAIESVFLLYRITGLEYFREAAWKMFQAIQKATETQFGNAAIDDVNVWDQPTQVDSMESFWMAETLKYFYLIFSPPDLITLDDWVLNTEAHPFRIPKV